MTALVRPFAALRPTAETAAAVVAPPYDVVSTDEARALAAGRPSSFLHISRPEIDLPEGSSPYSDEAYAQGARSLARLVEKRVLVRDDAPSFYVYRMVMNGRAQTGVPFGGSMPAYEEHRIRRHENTRPDNLNRFGGRPLDQGPVWSSAREEYPDEAAQHDTESKQQPCVQY